MIAQDFRVNLPVYLVTTLRKGKLVNTAGLDALGRSLALVEWDDNHQVQKLTFRSLLSEEEKRAKTSPTETAVSVPVKSIAEQVKARVPAKAKTKSKSKAKKVVAPKSGAKVTPMPDPRQLTIGDAINSKPNPFQPETRIAKKVTKIGPMTLYTRGTIVNRMPGQNDVYVVAWDGVAWDGDDIGKMISDDMMLESELDKMVADHNNSVTQDEVLIKQKIDAAKELLSEATELADVFAKNLKEYCDVYELVDMLQANGWSSSSC